MRPKVRVGMLRLSSWRFLKHAACVSDRTGSANCGQVGSHPGLCVFVPRRGGAVDAEPADAGISVGAQWWGAKAIGRRVRVGTAVSTDVGNRCAELQLVEASLTQMRASQSHRFRGLAGSARLLTGFFLRGGAATVPKWGVLLRYVCNGRTRTYTTDSLVEDAIILLAKAEKEEAKSNVEE